MPSVCNGSPGPFTTYQLTASTLFLDNMRNVTNSGPNVKIALGPCSPAEVKLAKTACKIEFSDRIDNDSVTYGVCCKELKVCAGFTKKELEAIGLASKIGEVEKCSDIPAQFLDKKAELIDSIVSGFETEIPIDIREGKAFMSTCTPKMKEFLEKTCNKFNAKSDKSGNKETIGYGVCCETLQICSGPFYTQIWFFAVCGGVVFLLIGVIAVVVYFFCIRKKRGGGKIDGGGMKSSKKSTKKSQSKN
ncbi:unnamed protein product [Caenorhabditis nigoni]